ncbi:hypothetical protein ACQJBY_009735 [Aegilops geniculata]
MPAPSSSFSQERISSPTSSATPPPTVQPLMNGFCKARLLVTNSNAHPRRPHKDYHGDTYHLIARNCNHFTADVCKHFTGKPTPGWVNRLARLALGSIRDSVLTEIIKVSAVRGETTHHEFSAENHNHQHAAQAIGREWMVAHFT